MNLHNNTEAVASRGARPEGGRRQRTRTRPSPSRDEDSIASRVRARGKEKAEVKGKDGEKQKDNEKQKHGGQKKDGVRRRCVRAVVPRASTHEVQLQEALAIKAQTATSKLNFFINLHWLDTYNELFIFANYHGLLAAKGLRHATIKSSC